MLVVKNDIHHAKSIGTIILVCVPLIYITQCYLMKAIFVTNVFGEYGSNKTRSTVIENGFLLFGKTLYGRE